MRAIPLLKISLPTMLFFGVALPLHAEPPTTTTHPAMTPAEAHAPRSRIGEVMGSLTQALRDAAEQQSHANPAPRPSPAAASPDASPRTSLPPDATAQATVP